jgi:ribosomal protein L12E/L44/L45/RPP1/RPP2
MSKTKSRGYLTKYEDVEVDVTIYVEDVLEYINDCATENELKIISKTASEKVDPSRVPITLKTLDDVFKMELLQAAFNKYSLAELESKLGRKCDLI